MKIFSFNSEKDPHYTGKLNNNTYCIIGIYEILNAHHLDIIIYQSDDRHGQ